MMGQFREMHRQTNEAISNGIRVQHDEVAERAAEERNRLANIEALRGELQGSGPLSPSL